MENLIGFIVSFVFGAIAGKLFFSKTTVIKVSDKKAAPKTGGSSNGNKDGYYKGTRNSADNNPV